MTTPPAADASRSARTDAERWEGVTRPRDRFEAILLLVVWVLLVLVAGTLLLANVG